MDEVTETLAGPTTGQALLFSGQIEEAEQQRKREYRYRADEVSADRPAVYAAITRELGEGEGLVELARRYHVHHRTVAAIEAREFASIEETRSRQAAEARLAARLQVHRMIAHPDCVPMQFAAPAAKAMAELAELLDGRATTRNESVKRVDIYSDWSGFVDSLRSEKEIGPGMGFPGGKIPALGAAEVIEGELAGEIGDQANRSAAADGESDALTSEQPGGLTAFPTGSGLLAAESGGDLAEIQEPDQGGGGGRVLPEGAGG